jgi:hypothetical protein
MRNANKIWSENPNKRYNLHDLSIDGKTVLECILQDFGGMALNGFIWLRRESNGGPL